jgi:hypothetical protein
MKLYRNPVRLIFSAGPWRSAWYLMAYLLVGSALAAVVLSALTVVAATAVTLALFPLLIAMAATIKGCAHVERLRAGAFLREPVTGGYRQTAAGGLFTRAKTSWQDPAIWRDIAYLLCLWPLLLAADTVLVLLWAISLGLITVPLWYWVPWMQVGAHRVHGYQLCCYFPHGPYGQGAVGVFVGSLHVALVVAAISLISFGILNYVLVIAARAQARVASALLRAPADPLAPAKVLLSQPGPLRIFIPNGRD